MRSVIVTLRVRYSVRWAETRVQREANPRGREQVEGEAKRGSLGSGSNVSFNTALMYTGTAHAHRAK